MMIQPKPVMTDANGDKWWFYLYSYDWDGKTYGFEICARSKEEADARLKRLPLARYDGQADGGPIQATPVSFAWIAMMTWWRNLWVKP